MITPAGVAIMVPTTSNPRSIDAERAFVKSFEYADLPGYAAVTVNGANVTAKIYSGVSRNVWRTVELSRLLQNAA